MAKTPRIDQVGQLLRHRFVNADILVYRRTGGQRLILGAERTPLLGWMGKNALLSAFLTDSELGFPVRRAILCRYFSIT